MAILNPTEYKLYSAWHFQRESHIELPVHTTEWLICWSSQKIAKLESTNLHQQYWVFGVTK